MFDQFVGLTLKGLRGDVEGLKIGYIAVHMGGWIYCKIALKVEG